MSDDLNLPGSPYFKGICPDCEKPNGYTVNCLCEKCEANQPILCPMCGDKVEPEHYNKEHQKCVFCLQGEAQEFAYKIINSIDMYAFYNELLSEIKVITDEYKTNLKNPNL